MIKHVDMQLPSNSLLISPNEATTLSFIDVLELMTLTAFKANKELMFGDFAGTRTVENTPVTP
jgi:hypothetical protein